MAGLALAPFGRQLIPVGTVPAVRRRRSAAAVPDLASEARSSAHARVTARSLRQVSPPSVLRPRQRSVTLAPTRSDGARSLEVAEKRLRQQRRCARGGRPSGTTERIRVSDDEEVRDAWSGGRSVD